MTTPAKALRTERVSQKVKTLLPGLPQAGLRLVIIMRDVATMMLTLPLLVPAVAPADDLPKPEDITARVNKVFAT
jgi:hypothetical protein